eukprot:4505218-Pleurochrysis_carterae.AAC.2
MHYLRHCPIPRPKSTLALCKPASVAFLPFASTADASVTSRRVRTDARHSAWMQASIYALQ